MFEAPPDTPMSIGDMVGRAAKACRNNLPLIFKVLIVPTIVLTIGALILQWIITYGPSNVAETGNWGLGGTYVVVGFVATLVTFAAGFVFQIRQLALTRLMLGFSPSYEAADKIVWSKKGGLVGMYLIGTICLFVGLLGFIVVGILGSFFPPGVARAVAITFTLIVSLWGAFLLLAIYMIAGQVAMLVYSCEELPMMTALGKGVSMTCKHLWRSMALGSLVMLAYMVVTYPLSLPVVAVTLFDLARQGLMSGEVPDSYKAPLYILVISQLWESIMAILVRPAFVFAFGLFYYDLRARAEGLDMRRKLERFRTKLLAQT